MVHGFTHNVTLYQNAINGCSSHFSREKDRLNTDILYHSDKRTKVLSQERLCKWLARLRRGDLTFLCYFNDSWSIFLVNRSLFSGINVRGTWYCPVAAASVLKQNGDGSVSESTVSVTFIEESESSRRQALSLAALYSYQHTSVPLSCS